MGYTNNKYKRIFNSIYNVPIHHAFENSFSTPYDMRVVHVRLSQAVCMKESHEDKSMI